LSASSRSYGVQLRRSDTDSTHPVSRTNRGLRRCGRPRWSADGRTASGPPRRDERAKTRTCRAARCRPRSASAPFRVPVPTAARKNAFSSRSPGVASGRGDSARAGNAQSPGVYSIPVGSAFLLTLDHKAPLSVRDRSRAADVSIVGPRCALMRRASGRNGTRHATTRRMLWEKQRVARYGC